MRVHVAVSGHDGDEEGQWSLVRDEGAKRSTAGLERSLDLTASHSVKQVLRKEHLLFRGGASITQAP